MFAIFTTATTTATTTITTTTSTIAVKYYRLCILSTHITSVNLFTLGTPFTIARLINNLA
ncbi:hypothetical protein GQX74_013256 [Glossina fuscipes]|nr:hypothetical protein GQX74_013256 [Glossina fuscipes]